MLHEVKLKGKVLTNILNCNNKVIYVIICSAVVFNIGMAIEVRPTANHA